MIAHYCKPCGETLTEEQSECPFCGQGAVPVDEIAPPRAFRALLSPEGRARWASGLWPAGTAENKVRALEVAVASLRLLTIQEGDKKIANVAIRIVSALIVKLRAQCDSDATRRAETVRARVPKHSQARAGTASPETPNSQRGAQ